MNINYILKVFICTVCDLWIPVFLLVSIIFLLQVRNFSSILVIFTIVTFLTSYVIVQLWKTFCAWTWRRTFDSGSQYWVIRLEPRGFVRLFPNKMIFECYYMLFFPSHNLQYCGKWEVGSGKLCRQGWVPWTMVREEVSLGSALSAIGVT